MNDLMKSVYFNLRGNLLRAAGHCVRQESDAPLQLGTITKILFIRLDRIGDVVLSTPALRALKQHFPGAELTVMLRSSTRGLVEHNPFVDRIVTVDRFSDLVSAIRGLRACRFDLVVDPYDDWPIESALVAGLSGARVRIGYAVAGREAFFNVRLRQHGKERHMTDVVMHSLKPLGISPYDVQPKVYLSRRELESAGQWLGERRGCRLPLIGVHPGASCETQRWPSEYYAQLGSLLLREKRQGLIVFGGPEDRERVDAIAEQIGEPVLTCVTEDIRRFSALVSYCKILVCNNSGPLHVACALGVPTVSVMGPTVKERWMPRGKRHRVLRANGLPCIGCNGASCRIGTHECMRTIIPEQVMAAIAESEIMLYGERQENGAHEGNGLYPMQV